MTKLYMGGVHKERVEASNSCVGTLIFGSFFFIVFCQSFSPAPFSLFFLSVLLSFLFLSNWFFYCPSFSLFFFDIILFLFFGSCGFISSLPQLA
jgi:hypothetical protein